MKVVLFGKLAETMGREVQVTDVQCSTVSKLRIALADRYPEVSADLLSPRVRALVDDEVVEDTRTLSGSDEVAFLPPVSGG